MRLDLLEKLLTSFGTGIPSTGIHLTFQGMRSNPLASVMHGIGILHPLLKKEGSDTQIALIDGMMLGIALSHGSQVCPALNTMIEGYLEQQSRGKGENIVDFAQFKAGGK